MPPGQARWLALSHCLRMLSGLADKVPAAAVGEGFAQNGGLLRILWGICEQTPRAAQPLMTQPLAPAPAASSGGLLKLLYCEHTPADLFHEISPSLSIKPRTARTNTTNRLFHGDGRPVGQTQKRRRP
jgi:hypothetical protein